MATMLPPDTSLADTVAYLVRRRYLASIAGGKATWILDSSRPIRSFGVEGSGVSLRFRYWMQHDPDHVFAELAAGRQPRR